MNNALSTKEKSKTKQYGHSLVPVENARLKDLMAVCIKIMVFTVTMVQIYQNTRWHIPEVFEMC